MTRLLTLPVRGPVDAAAWALGRTIEAAEAELYDEDRIVAELRAVADDFDRGLLSEREHAAAEAELLDRLRVARSRRASDDIEAS